MNGRLIGIDHGSKRIGLAVSDALGIVARELAIINRGKREDDFEIILNIARDQRAVGFVVGVPHNPNAPDGIRAQAETVKRWIARLAEHTDLPIAEVSEYLSSVEARELARQRNRAPDEPIDDLAARIILQSYLDAQSYDSATNAAGQEPRIGK